MFMHVCELNHSCINIRDRFGDRPPPFLAKMRGSYICCTYDFALPARTSLGQRHRYPLFNHLDGIKSLELRVKACPQWLCLLPRDFLALSSLGNRIQKVVTGGYNLNVLFVF